MISFTVKGKNPHPGARYWWPSVYYYENGQIVYTRATDAINKITISQTTVHFSNIPSNAGFAAGFFDANGESITEPFAFAATDVFVLKDGGSYVLDFHGEVGVPTLSEEGAPYKPFQMIPGYSLLEMLLPWMPFAGPPLPKFFPPWPWWEAGVGFEFLP